MFISLALATFIAAQPASPAPSSEPVARAAKKKVKQVCRTTYSSTSRMGAGKVCMTEAEWAKRRESSNKSAGDYSVNGTNRTSDGISGMAQVD